MLDKCKIKKILAKNDKYLQAACTCNLLTREGMAVLLMFEPAVAVSLY